MKENELDLDFVLETDRVSEIAVQDGDSDWSNDDVVSIDDEVLSEMTKGDEKPFFVEFTALYEGVSGNNRDYTGDAVGSCVDAMVGVNMYKGHVEPGTDSWKYREPVGKVVAARISEMSIGGRRVRAAKGKAYITEADAKLRSDIAKRMAGPLSILGNARAVRELGSAKRVITHIHKPLKSVDFCNPGTNGMPHAGVTAVVREMSGGSPNNQKPEKEDTPEMTTPKKLSRDELLAEYGPEIRAIVSEQLDDQIQEITVEKTKLAEAKTEFEADKKKLEDAIAEIKQQVDDLTKERDNLKKTIEEQNAAVIEAQLKSFAADYVAEMKKSDDHDERVVEMAAQDLEPTLIEGDLDKSKEDYKSKFAKSIEKTEKIFEMAGGKADVADDRTRNHAGNKRGKSKGFSIERFLSPELRKRVAGKE